MTEEKIAEIADKQEDINFESVVKEIAALKEEVRSAKEEAIAAKESVAVSKGNLTEDVKEASPYVFVEDFKDRMGYAENALAIDKRDRKNMAFFATHPEKWY